MPASAGNRPQQALVLVLSMVTGQETPAVLETPDIPADRWIRMLPPSSGAPKCNASPGACPRMVGTDGVPGTREKLVAM